MQNTDSIEASTVPAPIPEWLTAVAGNAISQVRGNGSFGFGDAIGEARAALSEDVIYPLPQLASLQAEGADVDSFLQGQLSNDLGKLTADLTQLSSYNSAKGRVIALLTLARHSDSVRLETRAELTAALIKRLRMYVMRAKVQWTDLGASHPLLGISGPNAANLLSRAGLPLPASEGSLAHSETISVVWRPGRIPRFTVQAPGNQLGEIWSALTPDARAVGPQVWQLLEILAGQPSIVVATQEHFVAQMLNLDTLGGISFTKGCYPGQEVVARLHYLGSLKRRMYLAYSDTEVTPGTSIYDASGDAQAVGEVVNSALHPQQGAAMLVVLQTQHQESKTLRLQSAEGNHLRIELAPGLVANS